MSSKNYKNIMSDITKKHKNAKELFLQKLSDLLIDHEWGDNLIKLTEQQCNFLPNYHLILFPSGLEEIIASLESWFDEKMLISLKTELIEDKIRAKIARALELRIIDLTHKNIILKQNSMLVKPTNLLSACKSHSKSCDIIWKYAGDNSNDFNYYSKRALLMYVYKISILFYLADNSENAKDTRKFIAENLENIVKFGKNFNKIKDKFKFPKTEDIPILRMFSH